MANLRRRATQAGVLGILVGAAISCAPANSTIEGTTGNLNCGYDPEDSKSAVLSPEEVQGLWVDCADFPREVNFDITSGLFLVESSYSDSRETVPILKDRPFTCKMDSGVFAELNAQYARTLEKSSLRVSLSCKEKIR